MGDDTKSNRRAMSLNDRHYRFLQDLSAPPKPSFNLIDDDEVEEQEEQLKMKVEEGRRLFEREPARETQDAHRDVPSFSGIIDFDSPSPEVEKEVKKTAKLEIEGRHSLCKLSSRDACNIIAGNEVKEEEEQRNVEVEEQRHLFETESARETQDALHDVPSFSGITDIDSSRGVEKYNKRPEKVMMEGRRRLCKLPDACNTIAGNEVKEEEEQRNVEVEERPHLFETESARETQDAHRGVPSFSGITDFDSSRGVEKYNKKPEKVMIEGRRRLCKLSSPDACSTTANAQIPDFDSPLPSKSQNNAGAGEIRDILSDLTSRLDLLSIEKKRAPARSESVAICISSSHRVGDPVKKVDVPEYESAESSFSGMSDPSDTLSDGSQHRHGGVMDADVRDEEEEEDDCVVLSRPRCNMNVAKKVITGKYHVEEESYVRYEHEGDNHKARVSKTHGLKKMEPKRVNEKLRYNGRPFVPNLRDEDGDMEQEEDGDEDGCLVLRGPSSTFNLPSAVAKILYPHQSEGLKWLWSLHCQGKGGILGDDMGLGKTMQICGFLAGLFHSRLIKRALIVAPKTLLPHWIKELSVVGLSSKTREYFGTSVAARTYELQYVLQDRGILLTTYDIVRNNSKSLQGDAYLVDEESEDGFTWDYMILDEGHLIKNPSTQRAKSLLEISCAHRIIISGTPIQNNLKELWALFNFCCPGLLGDNKQFKEKFEHAILRGNEKKASDRDKRVGSAAAKELRERIQPYFLRRLKTEVFNDNDATTAKLSKKNEIIVWLKLTSCQRELYEAFLNSELVLSAFDGSPLAALTILKKICDHPLLLTKRAAEDLLEGMESMLNPEEAGVAERLAMHLADVAERTDFQEKHDNISCKLSFILSLLDNLIPEGHNVLIFSQTRKMLNHIQESLSSNGYEFLRIDGTTKASDRLKIVSDFQEDARAPPIFLLTSQVGGLGLTLTKADRVIVVDPAWNPSTDNQSVDRAYRIGQTKDVLVYRLMTCGTVEEKIYRKQVFKGGLFKTATEQKEQIRYFSQQDLRELFSLPAQGFDISVTQQQLYEEHDSQHKMNEFLQAHLKFLETLGIAGVSHHSLLFSKTAPVQVEPEEERENRSKVATFSGNSSSSYTLLHDAEGSSQYAFNPKDVKLNRKSSSPNSVVKLTESEIKERINRLSRLIGNQVTVSRLPDKGAKIEKQISELKSELQKMRMETATERDVIDLDDLTGELARVLNV